MSVVSLRQKHPGSLEAEESCVQSTRGNVLWENRNQSEKLMRSEEGVRPNLLLVFTEWTCSGYRVVFE